jgi:hypothetical protein
MKRKVCILAWFLLIFVGSSLIFSAGYGVFAGANEKIRTEMISAHPGISEQGIAYEGTKRVLPIVNSILFVLSLLIVSRGVKKGILPGTRRS